MSHERGRRDAHEPGSPDSAEIPTFFPRSTPAREYQEEHEGEPEEEPGGEPGGEFHVCRETKEIKFNNCIIRFCEDESCACGAVRCLYCFCGYWYKCSECRQPLHWAIGEVALYCPYPTAPS